MEHERIDFHYIVTVQSGDTLNTREGILSVPPTFTRQQAYNFLIDQVREDFPSHGLLYFSFEPNRLDAR